MNHRLLDFGPGPIVVVAPHPDDDVLGCGGLICASLDRGTEVRVVSLTRGEASHPSSASFPAEMLGSLRVREQYASLRALGWSRPQLLNGRLPDGGVERSLTDGARSQATSAWLESATRGSRAIFVTCPYDEHPDHQAAANLAHGLGGSTPVFHYRVWPSSRAPQGGRVDLGVHRWLEHKKKAIAEHRSQLGLVAELDSDGFCLPSEVLERALCGTESFWTTP